MKLKINDLDRTDGGDSVVLQLSSNQEVIVGNEIVDKAINKYRLNLGTLAMLCSAGMFVLDIPGTLVEHNMGDEYADSDGQVIGSYRAAGFHIENPEGFSRPTIRLQTQSIEQMTFLASVSGKGVETLSTTAVVQHIPTTTEE